MRVRTYTPDDIEQLIDIQRECFPPPFLEEQLWNRDQLMSHISIFPQGAICVEHEGQLIGSCTALIIDWHLGDPPHSWEEVTDAGFIRTHNPRGNTLYGVDMAVRPSWRKQGIARLMYEARFTLVQQLGLERFMAGGRMPGYGRYQHTMSPEEYTKRVINNKLIDPVLTPQLRAGLRPVQVVHHYIADEESANCALLLEWPNPDKLKGVK